MSEKILIVDIKNQDVYYVTKEEYEKNKVNKKLAERINIEEQKANLIVKKYYDIANQDVYNVYVSKDGKMYDMEGFLIS